MRTFASMFLALSLLACGGGNKAPDPEAPSPSGDPVVAEPAPPDPGQTGGAPTPSQAELDAMFAKTLVFLEDMSVAVETNASNCAAMGPALDKVIDSHADLLALARKYEGNAEVDAKANQYMDAHKDRVEAATGKMGGLQGCSQDPGVQAAMKRFEEG